MASLQVKFVGEGLTYDDVLLVPNHSEVLPREVKLHAQFSRNIQLKAPIVSAAMDTVTESNMAIAMARNGGIGVVPKSMSIAAQANEVRKVKRSESGMIQDPVTLTADATSSDALAIMREHKIGGIPLVNAAGKLVGIVTNRDLRFEKNMSRPITELMTSDNLIVTQDGSDLSKAEQILREHRIEKLPVVDSDGQLVDSITYRDILKLSEFPNSCKDQFGRLRVAAAVGVTADTHERVAALVDAGVDAVIVDTAHGHSRGVMDTVRAVKEAFSTIDIVAGNVATAEAALALVDAGADASKWALVRLDLHHTCHRRGWRSTASRRHGSGRSPHRNRRACHCRWRHPLHRRHCESTGRWWQHRDGGFHARRHRRRSPGETIIYEGRRFKAYRGMGSVEAMQRLQGPLLPGRRRRPEETGSRRHQRPGSLQGLHPRGHAPSYGWAPRGHGVLRKRRPSAAA